MAKRDEIIKFLNKELNVKKIKDSSKNGLQFKGVSDVKKIGFAVDACMETFECAKQQNCDMVIVHHGLIWKKNDLPKKILENRLNYLKKNKLSLYACHLPLDLSLKYGNALEIAKILNLKKIKPFGEYHGINVGVKGEFTKNTDINNIVKIIDNKLNTKSVFSEKNKSIKTIGIVTGGGISCLGEAENKKLDCFLTGEEFHSTYHTIKESKINVILSGHYATETLGVKALMPLLSKKFKIETVFIDVSTGL